MKYPRPFGKSLPSSAALLTGRTVFERHGPSPDLQLQQAEKRPRPREALMVESIPKGSLTLSSAVESIEPLKRHDGHLGFYRQSVSTTWQRLSAPSCVSHVIARSTAGLVEALVRAGTLSLAIVKSMPRFLQVA